MFTELIKEVLISFSVTQDVNTNQISNKESQEKSEFAEDIHIIFGKESYFSQAFHFISFASPFQVSKNHQPNVRYVVLGRNPCIKLFGLDLYNFRPQHLIMF